MNNSPNINIRSPTIKRILSEVRELRKENSPHFHALPLQDNLFEWHFTIRGPSETDFDGGIYHGKIILPHDYPFNPPNIIFTTPNGRWETGKKICLTVSSYHPESWRPSWSIRTVLMAIIGFMPLKGSDTTGIGSLSYSTEQRQILAKKSLTHKCDVCGVTNGNVLPEPNENQNLKEEVDNALKDIAIEKIIDEKATPESPAKNVSERKEEKKEGEVITGTNDDKVDEGSIRKSIGTDSNGNSKTNHQQIKENDSPLPPHLQIHTNNSNNTNTNITNKTNQDNNKSTTSTTSSSTTSTTPSTTTNATSDTDDLEKELAYLTPSLTNKAANKSSGSTLDIFIFAIFVLICALLYKKFYM